MLDLLKNPWMIGVGGGILSGLIVWFLTQWVASRKDNSEYRRRVSAANGEVILSLRSGIAEQELPSSQVLEALMNSVARKHQVSRSDLHGSRQIAEELIREIMDSSFISHQTKKSYCTSLSEFIDIPRQSTATESASKELGSVLQAYRSRMINSMSLALATTTMLMTFVVALQSGDVLRLVDLLGLGRELPARSELVVPTLVTLVAGVATMMWSGLYSMELSRRRRTRSSIDKQSDNRESSLSPWDFLFFPWRFLDASRRSRQRMSEEDTDE